MRSTNYQNRLTVNIMSFSCHAQPSLICSPAPTEVGKLERNTPQHPPFPPTPPHPCSPLTTHPTNPQVTNTRLNTQNLGETMPLVQSHPNHKSCKPMSDKSKTFYSSNAPFHIPAPTNPRVTNPKLLHPQIHLIKEESRPKNVTCQKHF